MARKRDSVGQMKTIQKKQGIFGVIGVAAFLVLIIATVIMLFADFDGMHGYNVLLAIILCSGLVGGISYLVIRSLDKDKEAIEVAKQKSEAAQLKSIKRDAAQIYLLPRQTKKTIKLTRKIF